MFFFTLSIFTSESYYIKQLNTDKYLIFDKSVILNTPTYGDIKDADQFIFEELKENEKIIKSKKKSNLVFDIANSDTMLIMFPIHFGANQRFIFQPQFKLEKRTKIMNKNKCLTYNKDKNWFELRPCTSDDNDENQVFEFLTESDMRMKQSMKIESLNMICEKEKNGSGKEEINGEMITEMKINAAGQHSLSARIKNEFENSKDMIQDDKSKEGDLKKLKSTCAELLKKENEKKDDPKNIGGGFKVSNMKDVLKDKLNNLKEKFTKK